MTDPANQAFEDGVRHVARQLWPSPSSDGAAIFSLRERDGLFETDEQINLVEATVSRKKTKVADDLKKTARAVSELRRQNPDKYVRGWIVTLEDPTADQREEAKPYKGKCQLLSYPEFQAKLVDATTYISLRQRYRFGSIEALGGAGPSPALGDYIPLGLVDTATGATSMPSDVAQHLINNNGRYLLLGEYGAGKSMTMRFLFSEIVLQRLKQGFARFPVLLNLRDHFGQSNPVEALERHARNIGFPDPSQIVRAWRAGLVILLLDGFDEIASIAWTGNSRRLRDIRRDNMRLVRNFVEETPHDVGLVNLAESAHFRNCIIEVLEGRQSRNDLGDSVFDESCEISVFADAASTTDKILELPLSAGVRVLMTVLKKLFLQPGGGRRTSALHRGLDQRSRGLVPEVLNIVQAEKVASPTPMAGHDIWLPNRGNTARVRAILAAPANSTDPLVKRCNALT